MEHIQSSGIRLGSSVSRRYRHLLHFSHCTHRPGDTTDVSVVRLRTALVVGTRCCPRLQTVLSDGPAQSNQNVKTRQCSLLITHHNHSNNYNLQSELSELAQLRVNSFSLLSLSLLSEYTWDTGNACKFGVKQDCEAGTAGNGVSCEFCPPGRISTLVNSVSCYCCPPGYESSHKKIMCDPCAFNERSDGCQQCVSCRCAIELDNLIQIRLSKRTGIQHIRHIR